MSRTWWGALLLLLGLTLIAIWAVLSECAADQPTAFAPVPTWLPRPHGGDQGDNGRCAANRPVMLQHLLRSPWSLPGRLAPGSILDYLSMRARWGVRR